MCWNVLRENFWTWNAGKLFCGGWIHKLCNVSDLRRITVCSKYFQKITFLYSWKLPNMRFLGFQKYEINFSEFFGMILKNWNFRVTEMWWKWMEQKINENLQKRIRKSSMKIQEENWKINHKTHWGSTLSPIT